MQKRKQYRLLINLEEEEEEKRYLLVVDDQGPMGAEINQIRETEFQGVLD